MGYWNIRGVKNKLENDDLLTKFLKYDVLWVAEIKSSINAHIPGFICYRNTERYTNHGGICVYLKNALEKYISSVHFDGDNTIWVCFVFQPDIMFGASYIPPEDSSYFRPQMFGRLQSVLKTEGKSFILFGNFNSKIDSLKDLTEDRLYFRYPDQFPQNHNNHGAKLKSICADNNMLVVNNLVTPGKHFDNGPNFRKKK